MSTAVIKKSITAALKNESAVTVARKNETVEGRTFTGKLVPVEPTEEGTVRYAIRTGRPGRPVVVALDEIASLDLVAA